jgi:hypothetical protein
MAPSSKNDNAVRWVWQNRRIVATMIVVLAAVALLVNAYEIWGSECLIVAAIALAWASALGRSAAAHQAPARPLARLAIARARLATARIAMQAVRRGR